MDNKTQERMKADAKKAHPNSWQYQERIGYIAGATAENDRAKVLVDALEALKEGAENHTIRFIDKALEQWKSGKGKEVGDEM